MNSSPCFGKFWSANLILTLTRRLFLVYFAPRHRLFLPPAEPGVPLVANTTIARRALALASFKPLRIDYLVSLLKRSSNSFVVILPIIYRTSLVRVGTSVHRYDSHPLSSGNLQRYRIGHKKWKTSPPTMAYYGGLSATRKSGIKNNFSALRL